MMLEAVFSAVLAGLEALLEDEDEDEDEQRNKMKMTDNHFPKKFPIMLEAVFSAVLAGQEALLEDEDLEDEDEQRNKWKMKIVKDWTEEEHNYTVIGKDWTEEEFEDEDEQRNRRGVENMFNRVRQKRIMRKKMESEIIRLEALLEDEDLEDEDEQRNKWKMSSDQFDDGGEHGEEDNQQNKMKMSSDQFDDDEEVDADFDSARMFHKAIQPSIFNRVRENKSMNACFASEPSITRNIKDIIDFKLSVDQPKIIRKQGIDMDILAAMKSLGTECVNFSVTDSSLQNRAHVQLHHQCPRAPSIQRLPCRPRAPPVWIYDTGASFSLTENLSLLQPQPQLHGQPPQLNRQLRPQEQLHHQLPPPPVWIYDTGASFSLTGDLSLLPGVCSTGDCSPFLGLRRADPVSAANGQSVVSNKCGRASGTLNLSRTAPQTTGLISSSEPIAADNSSLLTPETTPEQTWRVASAAPQHMTGYLNHLIDYTPASGDQVIDTPNMGRMAVHGRGSVNTANITLQDVLYVPCLDANLVSTGQLAQLGYMITLGPYGCRIYKDDEDMPLVGEAHYVDGYLLELDFLRVRPSTN